MGPINILLLNPGHLATDSSHKEYSHFYIRIINFICCELFIITEEEDVIIKTQI